MNKDFVAKDPYGTETMFNDEFIAYWADEIYDDPFCDCPECIRWFYIVEKLIENRNKGEW